MNVREHIIMACKEGKEKYLKTLLDAGADPGLHLVLNARALGFAAEELQLCCVNIPLAAGANVNQLGFSRRNALSYAAEVGDDPIVNRLLEAGADVNNTDTFGKSCLSHATEYGKYTTIEILIKAGADLNIIEKNGFTCLIYAARRRARHVRLLLR